MKKAIIFPAGRGVPYCVDVPDGFDNDWVTDKIGGWMEIVRPRLLPGDCVMVVDEEGLLKGKPLNPVGCWFYESEKHGAPIVGTVLIMKEVFGDDGAELSGMDDDEVNKVFDSIGR